MVENPESRFLVTFESLLIFRGSGVSRGHGGSQCLEKSPKDPAVLKILRRSTLTLRRKLTIACPKNLLGLFLALRMIVFFEVILKTLQKHPGKTAWVPPACADRPGFLVLGSAPALASTFVSEPQLVALG